VQPLRVVPIAGRTQQAVNCYATPEGRSRYGAYTDEELESFGAVPEDCSHHRAYTDEQVTCCCADVHRRVVVQPSRVVPVTGRT
jgi:hypothetical protein